MYNCKSGCRNTITQRELEQKVLEIVSPMFEDYRVIVKQRQKDNATISSKRNKLMQKKQRLTELYLDGIIERSEFDRRKNEIESILTELEPAPELPEIHTDFNEMYHNLTTPKKAVFWRAFISSITVDRDKTISIEFHTAKVLAERLSTLNEIVPPDENAEV
jgi:hypothetical protein